MCDQSVRLLLVVALLLFSAAPARSAWWSVFSSQESKIPQHDQQLEGDALPIVDYYRAPFEMGAMAAPGSDRGSQLLEDLQKKQLQNSCWRNAYTSLFSSCREILESDDKKLRLAYKFVDCFLRSSGKAPLKRCSDSTPAKDCAKSLTDHCTSLLSTFYVEIGAICHHLQSEAFRLQTEEVIGNLKSSAHWLEGKLMNMQAQAKYILENTDKIFGLQQRMKEEFVVIEQGLVGMQEDLNKGIADISEYAEETNKHLQAVTSFQRDMADQQEKMAYQQQLLALNLEEEVSTLKAKSDDINNNVIKSLNGQEELLNGQEAALSGLTDLKKLQEDVFEGSRQLYEMHQSLAQGSQSILNAQEVFASKQALIFASLERLFSLHNMILTESRTLKTFLFYIPAGILIYLITGTRQTNSARAVLYIGLCISFGVEFWSLRVIDFSPFSQHEVISNALFIRGTYAVAALIYILYCIFTFKDYATLNYHLLIDMQRKLDENSSLLGELFLRPSTSALEYDEYYFPVACFKGYEDEAETNRKDDPIHDPDFNPEDDSDYDEHQTVVTSDYNLRRSARRSDRPLARSAAILYWETEEMFTNLFRPVTPR